MAEQMTGSSFGAVWAVMVLVCLGGVGCNNEASDSRGPGGDISMADKRPAMSQKELVASIRTDWNRRKAVILEKTRHTKSGSEMMSNALIGLLRDLRGDSFRQMVDYVTSEALKEDKESWRGSSRTFGYQLKLALVSDRSTHASCPFSEPCFSAAASTVSLCSPDAASTLIELGRTPDAQLSVVQPPPIPHWSGRS